MMAEAPNRSLMLGMRRGAMMCCPNCGARHLYRAYLKVRTCPVCGNANGRYPADDAPPYFTILIVGHLVVGPLLLFPWIWQWSIAAILAVIVPSLMILILALLPVVKGAVVGALWSLEARERPRRP